jgi:hypothetical protein
MTESRRRRTLVGVSTVALSIVSACESAPPPVPGVTVHADRPMCAVGEDVHRMYIEYYGVYSSRDLEFAAQCVARPHPMHPARGTTNRWTASPTVDTASAGA